MPVWRLGLGYRARFARYTCVLAVADVFTPSVSFLLMESIRLDLGFGSFVHL
jgi:hypothetical protein